MKRRVSLLLVALLLWLLPAQAELPLVYPEETVISVIRLTQQQRELAAWLYVPVLAGDATITLPEGTRYDDVGPAMQCLMLDYPELFHLGRTYSISYWQNEPEVAVSVTPTYRMDARAAERLRADLYEAALEVISADATAVGLHDALLARTSYGGDGEMRHTAVGALLYGQATCEGYAQALSLLYRMAGIPCGIVTGVGADSMTGQVSSHSWNVFDLDGYSLVDATWNDQEGAGVNTRWYFGLSTQQMAADHTPDDDMDVPECRDHAGWHRRMGLYADSQEDVLMAIRTMVRERSPLNLRVTDPALYRRIAEDPGAFLDAYNAWCPEGEAFYGRYTWLACDAQQCLMILVD